MKLRVRRTLRFVLCAAAALGLLAAVGLICFLPFAGRFLVLEDPLVKTDALVVLAGARAERWLEAVDLYREGWAALIVLSPGRNDRVEEDIRRRGIYFPPEAELVRNAIMQLGVPAAAVSIVPASLDNTADEAAAIRQLAAASGWRSLTIVTSKYHSRRTRFAFAREFDDTPVRIVVRTSRYDDANPARWWRDRDDLRLVTSELQKLVAYRLGLGR
jgi:uncharacterized SAM-binding protein YcdF (DUF218 family)